MEVQKQLGVDILLCVFVFISIKSTYKMPGVVPNSSHINVQTTSEKELPKETIRDAQDIFNHVVEAGERKKMFETLLVRGVGVPSIEFYHSKQANSCRVTKNKSRKISSIKKKT